MLGFNFFGSMSKLNLIGRERNQNNRDQNRVKIKQFTSYSALNETITEQKQKQCEASEQQQEPAGGVSGETNEEEVEARDTFEVHESKFYRVMTKSFYDTNLDSLKPYQKNESPSIFRRTRVLTKKLSERKMVISSPFDFQRVENVYTMTIRKRMMLDRQDNLKKSASMDDLLMDRDDGSLDAPISQHLSTSLNSLTMDDDDDNDDDDGSVANSMTFRRSLSHQSEIPSRISSEIGSGGKGDSKESLSSEEDVDKIVEEYNLVQMRNMSKSLEILKTVKDVPKGLSGPLDNKFPVDDESVQIRRNTSRNTRNAQTTDFDPRKKNSNAKNFEIRGVMKIHCSGQNWLIKQKDEYVLYENENLFRVINSTRKKELIKSGVVIRSARHVNSKSKEPAEVELKDIGGATYILTFASAKSAKQFMENDKIQVYASDHKVTIKDTLLKFLGKRSSREILERKGIYKNEPIFGNTLKEIYKKSQIPVPPFICKIIELIERPENVKSMGLYRTSGNLATIQKIRLAVDNGRLDILDTFSKDPDVLTGSLKLFFRELKEPLVPYCIYDQMADIIKIPLKQLTSKDHQRIKSIILKYLYESNLATFKVIMRHLVEVVRYKEDNKMDAYNLAVCWGPSLIFPNLTIGSDTSIDSPKDLMTLSHDATRLTDFLIGYYEMYPAELGGRPESFSEKYLMLKRQESKDSIESADSSTKSYKKSNSNLSLSVDEVMKRAIEYIEPNMSADGLYSRSGTPEKTNKILKKLGKKKSTELDKYKNEVHDICNALMIYLKEYPEPLVDTNTVETLAKIYINNQNHLEANLRRDVIMIIEKTARKDSLIFLLRHLAKVFNNQPLHKVSKSEMIIIWTKVLNYEGRIHHNNEKFAKFLTVAVEVFNDNLPDVVKSSFNNNGTSQNRNEQIAELMNDLRQHHERDRSSRYDNIDCDVMDEATLLDQKTEQTKL